MAGSPWDRNGCRRREKKPIVPILYHHQIPIAIAEDPEENREKGDDMMNRRQFVTVLSLSSVSALVMGSGLFRWLKPTSAKSPDLKTVILKYKTNGSAPDFRWADMSRYTEMLNDYTTRQRFARKTQTLERDGEVEYHFTFWTREDAEAFATMLPQLTNVAARTAAGFSAEVLVA